MTEKTGRENLVDEDGLPLPKLPPQLKKGNHQHNEPADGSSQPHTDQDGGERKPPSSGTVRLGEQGEYTRPGVAVKKKAKAVVSSFSKMLHARVLGMLSPKDRELLSDCFDDEGKKLVKDDTGDYPKNRALWRYSGLWLQVDDWLKKRTKDGSFLFTVPSFIWLQPDLSPNAFRK